MIRVVTFLLAVSLTLGLTSGFAQLADFQHFGNFKRMMHTGDTAGQVELSKLSQVAGTWGVGALAELKGEIIQVDGKLLVSLGTDPKGKVQLPSPYDSAALWASDKVMHWKQISVPGDMNQLQFEKFVSDQAASSNLDLGQPFAFRVTGNYSHLIWHVLTGEKVQAKAATQEHGNHAMQGHRGGHSNKQSGMTVFRSPSASGQLVGIYSGEKLEGVVSHPGERFHVHFIDHSQAVSGHVDQYSVNRGATLWLPDKQAR